MYKKRKIEDTGSYPVITSQQDRERVHQTIEAEKTDDVDFTGTRRATLAFLFTITMLYLYSATELGSFFGIMNPSDETINQAIQAAAQSQLAEIANGATIFPDAQSQLTMLNAVRDYASQTRVVMWGYSHTPSEWMSILREISPDYIGPILDICMQVLTIYRNVSAGAKMVSSDVSVVLYELSSGNIPVAPLARLQSYSNIFYALSPIIAGLGLSARVANTGVRTILGNGIIGILSNAVSVPVSAAASASLSIVDFIASIILDVQEDPSLMQRQESIESSSQGSVMAYESTVPSSNSTLGYAGGLVRLARMIVDMVREIDGIVNQNASDVSSVQDSITTMTNSLNRLSVHSQQSIYTYQTAVSLSQQVMQDARRGNNEIASGVAPVLSVDRMAVESVLNSSSSTIGPTLHTIIGDCEEETQMTSESQSQESQESVMSTMTASTANGGQCSGLTQLAKIASAANFMEAIEMMKNRRMNGGRRRRMGRMGRMSGKTRKTRKTKKMHKMKQSRKCNKSKCNYKGCNSSKHKCSHRRTKSKR